MSTRGRRGRGRGELNRLRRQLQTIKVELRDSNTGRFKKNTACIRLPPHEVYAKQFRTARLQHSTNANSGTINLSAVTAACKPAYGQYNLISATTYGPYVATGASKAPDTDRRTTCWTRVQICTTWSSAVR